MNNYICVLCLHNLLSQDLLIFHDLFFASLLSVNKIYWYSVSEDPSCQVNIVNKFFICHKSSAQQIQRVSLLKSYFPFNLNWRFVLVRIFFKKFTVLVIRVQTTVVVMATTIVVVVPIETNLRTWALLILEGRNKIYIHVKPFNRPSGR